MINIKELITLGYKIVVQNRIPVLNRGFNLIQISIAWRMSFTGKSPHNWIKYWLNVCRHYQEQLELQFHCYRRKLGSIRIYTSTIAMLVDSSLTDPVCDAPLTLSCSVFRYSFLTDDVLTLTERAPVYNI